ncbi:MAG: hypothetical protein Q7T38_03965 [Gallionella sp.]|nr:hypothetical protein [Gallionella sp.]
MRYDVKSEALSSDQRQLFEDDIVQDIAAVKAELKFPVAGAVRIVFNYAQARVSNSTIAPLN